MCNIYRETRSIRLENDFAEEKKFVRRNIEVSCVFAFDLTALLIKLFIIQVAGEKWKNGLLLSNDGRG